MTYTRLNIRPGLIADDTPAKVGTAGAVACSNVRPWREEWETIGGWESATLDTLPGKGRSIHVWKGENQILVAIGSNEGLFILRDGVLVDITPASFVAGREDGLGGAGYGTGAYGEGRYGEPSLETTFLLTWSLANRGTQLVANPRGQTIYTWDEPDPLAVPLTNAPSEVAFMRVSAQRQIIAYGCNEEVSGEYNPRAIRYSDIEFPTVWATASDNNAGEYILEDQGRIVAAITLEGDAIIFTDASVYQETFLGNPGQVFDYRRLGTKSGLSGPNAFCELNGVIFYKDPSFKIWAVALGSAPQRVVSPVATSFGDRIDPIQRDKTVGVSITEYQEVWFFFQSNGAEDVDGYVAFNAPNNLWFEGDVSRIAFHDATPLDFPIGVSPDGMVYFHEKGFSDNGGPLSWFLETGDVEFQSGSRMALFRGLRPDFKSQIGTVNLTFITRDGPQGGAVEAAPIALRVDQQESFFFIQGRNTRLRFSGSSAPARCRFGTMHFDIKATGRR